MNKSELKIKFYSHQNRSINKKSFFFERTAPLRRAYQKISYERSAYESVDEGFLSLVIFQKDKKIHAVKGWRK